MHTQSIFKAYDIRGIYGKDFDDEFAFELGKKVTLGLKAKVMIVGHDVRTSSVPLMEQLIKGIRIAGCKVISIGETTTPMFYSAVRTLGADFGFMVTSSHNTSEYNGFKVARNDGSIVDGMAIKSLWEGNSEKSEADKEGDFKKIDFGNQYIEQIIAVAGGDKIKTSVAVEGPPAVKKNIQLLSSYYGFDLDDGAPIKAIFDPDGDRIHFTEHGIHIPSEFIFLAFVERFKPNPVVCELRFSRSVLEALDGWNISYKVAKVGRPYIHEQMKKENAGLGGEISGHFYFKEFGYLEAPEYMLVRMLMVLEMSGQSLRQLMEPHLKYLKSEEINVGLGGRSWESILEKLKDLYKDKILKEIDGITVDAWDDSGWWCNVRPSHTEPLVRMVLEAKTNDLLEKKVIEIRDRIG